MHEYQDVEQMKPQNIEIERKKIELIIPNTKEKKLWCDGEYQIETEISNDLKLKSLQTQQAANKQAYKL